LLQLEYEPDYREKYEPALRKAVTGYESVAKIEEGYSPDESKAIDNVEKTLRHFLTSAFIESRGIDHGLMNEAYAWYLKLFRRSDRELLGKYIRYFWPTVYVWAHTFSKAGGQHGNRASALRAELAKGRIDRRKARGLPDE
jgi:hypothetical protein